MMSLDLTVLLRQTNVLPQKGMKGGYELARAQAWWMFSVACGLHECRIPSRVRFLAEVMSWAQELVQQC